MIDLNDPHWEESGPLFSLPKFEEMISEAEKGDSVAADYICAFIISLAQNEEVPFSLIIAVARTIADYRRKELSEESRLN